MDARGVWGVEGNAGRLNAYVSGRINNHSARMLIDTGTFVNYVSLKILNCAAKDDVHYAQ